MDTEKGSNNNSTNVQEQSAETLDYREQIDQKQQDRELGAKILSQANFESRHQPIVDSSFDKARRRGEKLPGKNNERRNYSYLSRVERLVDKYGNRLEKRLWDRSADQLIISPKDITNDYWHSQEQILRDNGQGHTLSDREKQILVEDIQKNQRNSLKSWSDYLGNEESPYPMWFKVYAWDGMSKMGTYDKDKGRYTKRDKHTVAPYPECNAEILSTVFGWINDFYNISEREAYSEHKDRDEELEAIVASGNFSRLYALAERGIAPIIPTPENPEDIHGEWVEYLPDQEKELALASKGTGWCISNPATGRAYLHTGHYGQMKRKDSEKNANESQAKFLVFHLYDPNNAGKLARNGCLAILLDKNGRVTNEVRGLGKGQDIEDALIPTLQEKLKTLPGGERKLAALADKKQLITLDRKMQNDEGLTKEELEFLYEINRPIRTLGTYSEEDPRIEELREKYNAAYAITAGVDANQIVPHLNLANAAVSIDELINHGVDMDKLAKQYYNGFRIGKMPAKNDGANIDQFISRLDVRDIISNLDMLIRYGADIDIDELARQSSELARGLGDNIELFIKHGLSADKILEYLPPRFIAANLDTFAKYNINVDTIWLIDQLHDDMREIKSIIQHTQDIDQLVNHLSSSTIFNNLDTLMDHQAHIDIDKVMDDIVHYHPNMIPGRLKTLKKHGIRVNIDELIPHFYPTDIIDNFDDFIEYGAHIDINELTDRLIKADIDPEDIKEYLNDLQRYGDLISS